MAAAVLVAGAVVCLAGVVVGVAAVGCLEAWEAFNEQAADGVVVPLRRPVQLRGEQQ